MADTFTIEIASPERLLTREQATEAQIPAQDGYIGVLPDHAPLLSALGAGVLTYIGEDRREHVMAIRGGFLEILDNCVRVLTDTADKSGEIDVPKAQEALKAAQEQMINPAEGIDIASALIAVQHEQAKIDAAQKSRSE